MRLLTPRSLLTGGHTRRDIERLLASGELRRVAHGVYTAQPPQGFTQEHLLQLEGVAAELASDAVVSHESAAVLHGLPLPPGWIGPVRITRPRRSDGGGGQRTRTMRVRRADILESEMEQITLAHWTVPVTTQARTVIDLARESTTWGVVAADAALRNGISRESLQSIVDGHVGRHGVARAREVVRLANPLAESPADSLSRMGLVAAGVPHPELQFELRTPSGRFVARGDFGWPEFRVMGECDGLAKYEDPDGRSVRESLRREKDREAAIRDLGWWVVRWTYADIATVMARRVASALRAHGWDGRR